MSFRLLRLHGFRGLSFVLSGAALLMATCLCSDNAQADVEKADRVAAVEQTERVTATRTESYWCAKCQRNHTRVVNYIVEEPITTSVEPTPTQPQSSASKATAEPTVSEPTVTEAASTPQSVTVRKPAVEASSSASVEQSSATTPVLGMLNAQRSRRGLRTLQFDADLQRVAELRVLKMVRMRMKGHPPGSIAPGRYEGVGWTSNSSPSEVRACYTSSPNMRVAGAAMAHGPDGVYFAVVYR